MEAVLHASQGITFACFTYIFSGRGQRAWGSPCRSGRAEPQFLRRPDGASTGQSPSAASLRPAGVPTAAAQAVLHPASDHLVPVAGVCATSWPHPDVASASWLAALLHSPAPACTLHRPHSPLTRTPPVSHSSLATCFPGTSTHIGRHRSLQCEAQEWQRQRGAMFQFSPLDPVCTATIYHHGSSCRAAQPVSTTGSSLRHPETGNLSTEGRSPMDSWGPGAAEA